MKILHIEGRLHPGSGANADKDAQAARLANAFLVKPFKTSDLQKTVQSLLEPAVAASNPS